MSGEKGTKDPDERITVLCKKVTILLTRPKTKTYFFYSLIVKQILIQTVCFVELQKDAQKLHIPKFCRILQVFVT
jgi:hypothetical protein